MAVGPKSQSAATQAAAEAQAAAAASPQQAPVTDPAVEPVVTPAVEPAETPAAPAEKAQATDLDMTKTVDAVKAAEKAEPKAETEPAAAEPSLEDLDALVTGAGFDLASIGERVKANNGKFPADLVAELSTKLDPALVSANVKRIELQIELDTIKAEKASKAAEKMNDFIFSKLDGSGDAAKGKENFTVLKDWCTKNMSQDDINAVNELLRSPNKSVVEQGLTMAVNKWKGAQEPTMMTGDAIATPAKPEFVPLAKSEFQQIMRSDKYRTDPAYATEIDARRRKTMDTEAWTPPGFYA